jgi:hypothetical protein
MSRPSCPAPAEICLAGRSTQFDEFGQNRLAKLSGVALNKLPTTCSALTMVSGLSSMRHACKGAPENANVEQNPLHLPMPHHRWWSDQVGPHSSVSAVATSEKRIHSPRSRPA